MIYQRTLKKRVSATGVGLHSGEKISISLRPALADTGILFRRTDLASGISTAVPIAASVENVCDTRLATSLGTGDTKIATIEHLMAAFAGLGIDNAIVELDGCELPIMDGSAAPFVYLIQSAGIDELSAPKKFIRILRDIVVEDDGARICLSPYNGFRLEYTLEYDHPVFLKHACSSTLEFSSKSFVRDIARARTFGFLSDFERLRSMDLARGGSLDNTVVMDEFRILNKDGLRLDDEFVKHKMLDAIGDLYLLGHSLIGSFKGFKSGHTANYQLLLQVLEQSDAWEYVTFAEAETAPVSFAQPVFA